MNRLENGRKPLTREFLSFTWVGALNTALAYGVFVALAVVLEQVHYLVVLALAFMASSVVSFLTQRYLVFKVKKFFCLDFFRFTLSGSVAVALNGLALVVLIEGFGFGVLLAQTVATGLSVPVSYFLHRFFSFSRRSSTRVKQDQALSENCSSRNRLKTSPNRDGPLVSVVVPTYNNSETIEQTLNSVLSQTYENLEIIVSDHSSTDSTETLIRGFASDRRIKVLRFDGPHGAHWNWNFASSQASGELMTLVCGDDFLHPTAIEVKVRALKKFPSAVMSGTKRSIVDDGGNVLIRSRGLGPLIGLNRGEDSVRACVRAGTNLFGEPMCVMFRTATFVAAGGWETQLPYVIDQATYLKVLRHGDFVGVPEALAYFRLSKGQLSYRLAKRQAIEVKQLHKQAESVYGYRIGAIEVGLGNVRAQTTALLRRLLYATLSATARTG